MTPMLPDRPGRVKRPRARAMLRRVKAKWLLVIAGPTLLLLAGSVLAVIFLPFPVPRTATPVQRLYLSRCATCHGSTGEGSWRATIFLMRPGNLRDPGRMAGLSDDYLLNLIKNGGATVDQPRIPPLGCPLTDSAARRLMGYP